LIGCRSNDYITDNWATLNGQKRNYRENEREKVVTLQPKAKREQSVIINSQHSN